MSGLPIAVLLFWLVRALIAHGQGSRASPASRAAALSPLNQPLELPFRLTNLVRFFTWIVWLVLLDVGEIEPLGSMLALHLGLAIFNLPRLSSALAVRVLPPKVAFYVIWLLMPRWTWSAPHAGALLIVLREHRRRGPPDPALLAWLETRLDHYRQPPPLALVAMAALDLARGRQEAGFGLLGVVAALPRVPGRDPARRLALDRLMAEAWSAGDLSRVVRLGLESANGSVLRPPHGARVVARAVLSAASLGGSGRPLLWISRPLVAWRLSPALDRLERWRDAGPSGPLDQARRAELAALAALLPPRARAAAPERAFPEPPEGDPEAVALALHRDLLARATPSGAELGLVAAAWDRFRWEEALLARVKARAEELRAPLWPEDPLATRFGAIEADLATILRERGIGAPGFSRTAQGAFKRAREAEIATLQDLLAETRGEAAPPLGPYARWRRWAEIRGRIERILPWCGPLDRRALLQDSLGAVLDFGADCYNGGQQRVLTRTIMLWILHHAEDTCSKRFVEAVRGNTRLPL